MVPTRGAFKRTSARGGKSRGCAKSRRVRVPPAIVTIVVAAALALAAILAHDRLQPAKPLLHAHTDFTTFYCAGVVVRAHGDPYRVEPLRACQQRLDEFGGGPGWLVVPAPFPGYVLALFALVSLLPFAFAHGLWYFAILVSTGLTGWALARITGFPLIATVAVVATPLGLYDVGFGEPTPIAAALLALGAERAARGAWRGAGTLVGLAMIEPHLVLPAFLSLLLFAPRARVALLTTAALLALVSFVTIGLGENLEYFSRVLPAQLASEIHWRSQFSLTHLLALLGAGDRVASMAGSVSYVVMVILAVWAGRRLARAANQPAAIGLIAGGFSHDNQILTAVGATILVASLRGVPRVLALVPLLAFAVTWTGDASWRLLVLATTVSAAAALWLVAERLDATRSRRAMSVAALAVLLLVTFTTLQRLPQPAGSEEAAIAAAPVPAIRPDDGAAAIWSYRNHLARITARDERFELEKVPFEIGLLALLACAFAARPRELRSAR
jgi:glycosyl transferase family 87